MTSHATDGTEHQGCAVGVPFYGLACCIADDQGVATCTFSTRVSGIDAAGDDAFLPCLVLSTARQKFDPSFDRPLFLHVDSSSLRDGFLVSALFFV
jgi:hypothetical protein